jgi:hypothetical protein
MNNTKKPRKTTTLKISIGLHKQLQAYADKHGLRMLQLVNRIIAEFLDQKLKPAHPPSGQKRSGTVFEEPTKTPPLLRYQKSKPAHPPLERSVSNG